MAHAYFEPDHDLHGNEGRPMSRKNQEACRSLLECMASAHDCVPADWYRHEAKKMLEWLNRS